MATTAMNRLAAAGLILSLLAFVPRAQAANPGDVYYSAHVVQKFKYGAFGGDVVTWNDVTVADTLLVQTVQHDTMTVRSAASTAAALEANSGRFEADLTSEIIASADHGLFHQTYNDIDVEVYVRGPFGTPYDITLDLTASLLASREGGAPGTLQDVNGTSWADFDGTTLTVSNGGTDSLAVASSDTLSGTSTTEILVNGEVYSLAYTFIITSGTSTTQAICILGCMTEAADFHALVSSQVAINTYLNGLPTSVPRVPRAASITLLAFPNPLQGATTVSFLAPQGARTTVDVFDVAGRRVTTLYDALATGGVQTLPWNATSLPSGVYFLRARGEEFSSTKKLVLLK